MTAGTVIKSVRARQIFSDRGHPGVEAAVVVENGAVGVAMATAGVSIGEHEIQFVYDKDPKYYNGMGVNKAVSNVNDIIAPKIKGIDACKQRDIDQIMLDLDGTPLKTKLGGNATAAVSAAVLKAAAAGLGIPLYQHIGGVNACVLPTPGVLTIVGSERYGGSAAHSGGKPSYSIMCYGYKTLSAASYACYEVFTAFEKIVRRKYKTGSNQGRIMIGPGCTDTDEELWADMKQAISDCGGEGKMGIQVDMAATTYWDKKKEMFVGLIDKKDKTADDLLKVYKKMVKDYPFVVLEDPMEENDYEGHARVAKALPIQVVGDDLFTTNMERLKQGIALGSANTMLLKVNQIGTISEAFDSCNTAFRAGWGVMPCSSRGEGADIGDYAVGLNTGNIRESGLGASANRLLQIEAELGDKAQFLGKAGFKSGFKGPKGA
jgi:enolase